MSAVVEKREELKEKQKLLMEVAEAAADGDRYDFSRQTVIEKLAATDADHAFRRFKELNREADDLGVQLRQAEAAEIKRAVGDREKELKEPVRGIPHPVDNDGPRSFGQRFVEHKDWKASRESRMSIPVNIDIDLKTLFTTTAGFAPESVRTGRLVDAVTRPIQVLDLIPSRPMTQAVEKYMEETTRTHAAAETVEGAAFKESTFVWTEKTSTVRKITDSVPVTDEVLEDDDQVRGIIDRRVRFGLRQRLDLQVLVGDGVSPNLEGVNNVTGIQTQALGTDDRITAFAKALTKIRFTGRAEPSGAVFHPNDWQAYMLLKNSNGDFLFGNPFSGPGPTSLLGIPVAQSDAQTENTGLVGDWMNFSQIGERRGVTILVGFTGSQFTEGESTVRGDLRANFTVYRPAAFATITGI